MDEGEHERLRRAAYSRDASTADVAALTDFESRQRRLPVEAPQMDAVADPIARAPEPEPEAAAPATVEETPHPRRRRRILVTALIAVAALAIGGLSGWLLKPNPPAAPLANIDIPADSSLLVFADPVAATDPLPLANTSPEGAVAVRYLGTVSEHPVFGALTIQSGPGDTPSLYVCVSVEFTDMSGSSCSSLVQFLADGVGGTTSSGADAVSVHWGPSGAPVETGGGSP